MKSLISKKKLAVEDFSKIGPKRCERREAAEVEAEADTAGHENEKGRDRGESSRDFLNTF